MDSLLKVKNLHTYFYTPRGIGKALEEVSFNLNKGECVGLVGESGCGKTILGLSILRLVPEPGKIIKGNIYFNGKNLTKIEEDKMREIRGREIAMIFQEPMSCLNPLFTIGSQIIESLRAHFRIKKSQAIEIALKLLEDVEISDPRKHIKDFPHSLSGGLRQRAMIAIALSCKPSFLIADEPTTALDVTIQAQILSLLHKLIKEIGLTILFITHDISLVEKLCNKIIIMYAGRIVEEAEKEALIKHPHHPYTYGLLKSLPKIDTPRKEKLYSIPGSPPDIINKPSGCPFHPRCWRVLDKCKEIFPDEEIMNNNHRFFCHNPLPKEWIS